MIDAAGLRVIKAISDEGSFTSAAAALGYSQPAISQMVRRLEQRTGTVLVERVGRKVRLTEAGDVLARHAVGVLSALDAAEEEVAAIAGLRAGRVRLTAFPSSSSTLVPGALALVRQRHPQVSVSFLEAEPPEALAALRRGDTDLAVTFRYTDTGAVRGDDDGDQFVALPLLEDHVRLAVPRTHRLASATRVDMADLKDETWIAGCPRCRSHLVNLCTANGYSPTVSFETEDYVAVLGFVAAGLGVALVPDLILTSAGNSEVVGLPIDPSPTRVVELVTTPDLQRVPAVQATVQALSESAEVRRELIASGQATPGPCARTPASDA